MPPKKKAVNSAGRTNKAIKDAAAVVTSELQQKKEKLPRTLYLSTDSYLELSKICKSNNYVVSSLIDQLIQEFIGRFKKG